MNNNDTSSSTMTYTDKLLNLLLQENKIPQEVRDRIEQRAEEFWQGITSDAGKFLHFDLDHNKHTEDKVKTMLQCIPESLSEKVNYAEYEEDEEEEDDDYMLPIRAFIWHNFEAIPFIPLLAEEGEKNHVGGEGTRGELFLVQSDRRAAMGDLVEYYHDDVVCFDVMKRLREQGLLKREDITKHYLLHYACHSEDAKKVFEYLVDWDPTALKELFHSCWRVSCIGRCFKLALMTSLKYFPQELGLLLLKGDHDGKSVIENVYTNGIKMMSKKEAWGVIKGCLDNTDTKKQVLQRNQNTNLYPFMLAAEGSAHAHLDLVYYLLRQKPEVIYSVPE